MHYTSLCIVCNFLLVVLEKAAMPINDALATQDGCVVVTWENVQNAFQIPKLCILFI